MESLLQRGEKLDDLVAKSEHLGNQSKAFYKTVSSPDHTEYLLPLAVSWMHVCVHVNSAGTETELMLWNHVMPLPRPHGHASLCLSALPTTPIMHLPPVANTKDRTDAVYSGMGHQDKSKSEAGAVCGQSVSAPDCGWWGLKELWGLSGEEVIFEFVLTSQRVNICVLFGYQLRM